MEKIRKSKEEEKTLLEVMFKMPVIFHVSFLNFIIIFFLVFGAYLILGDYEGMIYYLLISLFLIFVYLLVSIGIKKQKCKITNKAITGRKFIFFGYKEYQYKMDMIDSVEAVKMLGVTNIKITFTQGYISGPSASSKPVNIGYVKNYDEAVAEIRKIINKIKSDKDVTAKLSENQTKALNNIANSISTKKKESVKEGKDVASKIKQLKELLENGLITQEEFDSKRKKILDNL